MTQPYWSFSSKARTGASVMNYFVMPSCKGAVAILMTIKTTTNSKPGFVKNHGARIHYFYTRGNLVFVKDQESLHAKPVAAFSQQRCFSITVNKTSPCMQDVVPGSHVQLGKS